MQIKVHIMNVRKSLLPPLATVLIASCASNPKSTFVYVQIFDAGVSYPKATSQCQYEDHLQRRADARADINTGRGFSAILSGKPSNTQILCMNRFGWELQEQVAQAASTPK